MRRELSQALSPDAEGSSSPKNLTGRQQAVLVGTLLGDGCLAKHGRFHRLHIKHKAAHRALAEFGGETEVPSLTLYWKVSVPM